jgi:4-aminobutyrate aminotransferase / (S)-3-amino-2-methylpropionate transaminase / 5-aminovalerate transaminase
MATHTNSETLGTLRGQVMAKGNASGVPYYIDRAKGALLWDVDGNEYIDFAGGIAVMNVGHSHPKVVAAIKDQAEKFTHTCFMVLPYEPAVRLAAKLEKAVPGSFPKASLFVNSGAEAVENAVKIARYATGRQGIICFENAFHGRTYLGMSLTSKVKPYKYGFGPFVPEIYRMPYAYCYRCSFGMTYPDCGLHCADHLRSFFVTHVAAEQTAAVIAEPILGEGGFVTPPVEYFGEMRKICDEFGILLIADEIQTGMGRTGALFAMEHYKVEADLTTVAKSLAAGMPLSAVVGRKEIMDKVHLGGIGGTYGGNPVACAAALAVFDVIESEDLLARATALGKVMRARFDDFKEKYALVGDVRGIGPMLALELVSDRETKAPAADAAKALVKYCLDRGLVLLSCGSLGNVIRVLMPLVITDEQLDKGLSIMEEGLAALDR